MQTAYSFFGNENIRQLEQKKASSARGFRFVPRDLDILEFTLEMKFSDLELIHQKFFSVTSSGIKSNSDTWARQRIQILLKSGMLAKNTDTFKRPLLTVTQKGYFYLQNSRPFEGRPRSLLSVDYKTFEHDRLVSNIRLELERRGECTDWVSERRLYDSDVITRLLSSEYRPDGIYTDPSGKKIALELELSRKSKDRYKQKIKKYIQVVTSNYSSTRPFDTIHYVIQKPQILELLKSESQIYHSYFRFTPLSEILAGEVL